jgi:hypothetical protein
MLGGGERGQVVVLQFMKAMLLLCWDGANRLYCIL